MKNSPLEFEHIVQVNDLLDRVNISLRRRELWDGLLLRARRPDRFNDALICESSEIVDNRFERRTEAGDQVFTEIVTLKPEESIITKSSWEVDANSNHAESLTQIEEPEPNFLFVRFRYKRDIPEGSSGVDIGQYLKSAYVQLDSEAISKIRMMVEQRSILNN
jgi:hypothetical protein